MRRIKTNPITITIKNGNSTKAKNINIIRNKNQLQQEEVVSYANPRRSTQSVEFTFLVREVVLVPLIQTPSTTIMSSMLQVLQPNSPNHLIFSSQSVEFIICGVNRL